MTDKQINKWLRRRFSRIGWLLLLYYGLMTLLTNLTAFADMAKQSLWPFFAGDFSGPSTGMPSMGMLGATLQQ